MWPVERSALNFPFVVINDEDIDFSSIEKEFRRDRPLDTFLDLRERNTKEQVVSDSSVDDSPLSAMYENDEQRRISFSSYQNALGSAPPHPFEPIPLNHLVRANEQQQLISDDESDLPVEAFPDEESCTCQYSNSQNEEPQQSPSQGIQIVFPAAPFASETTRESTAPSNSDIVDAFSSPAEENYKDVSAKEIEDVLSDDSTYFENYDFKQSRKKFRDYQMDQWERRYKDLRQVYLDTGKSSVHHADASKKSLARWIKRQRAQYKLLQEGKPSSMTEDRIDALNLINFVWDSHSTVWEDRVQELKAFRVKHNHCNVTSSNYPFGSSLVSWVKSQRRQYRMMKEGKKSNLTPRRIHQLESLGFQF